jgi:hypothetical protein
LSVNEGEVLEAAKTMNPAEFQVQHPEHWMIRRAGVERIMIEAQVTRKTIWKRNGRRDLAEFPVAYELPAGGTISPVACCKISER